MSNFQDQIITLELQTKMARNADLGGRRNRVMRTTWAETMVTESSTRPGSGPSRHKNNSGNVTCWWMVGRITLRTSLSLAEASICQPLCGVNSTSKYSSGFPVH